MRTDWVPPTTPHRLLQEKYWPNRWKVAVICIFLNCTRRASVEKIIDEFFEHYFSPQKFIESYENDKCREDLIELIKPLGFKARRAKQLYEFSVDFLKLPKDQPILTCRGIGDYASQCDRMYFFKDLDDVPPNDTALVKVWHWLKESAA